MNNCTKCGNQVPEGVTECPVCGQVISTSVEPVAESAPVVEPVTPVEPVAEPAPVVEPVTPVEPVAEPAPVVEPVTPVEPVAEPTPVVAPVTSVEPVAEPAPVAEPVIPVEPVAEPAPVVEPVTPVEPVAEPAPVVEPVTPVEPVAEPTPAVVPVTPVQPVVEPTPVVTPATSGIDNVAPVQTAPAAPTTESAKIKSSNKTLFVVGVVALSLIIVGLIVFIIIKLTSSPSGSEVGGGTPTPVTTAQQVSNSNTQTIGGYTFTIPSGYNSQIQEGLLIIVDNAKTMGFVIKPIPYSYEVIASQVDELKKVFEENGATIKSTDKKTYGGIEHLLFYADIEGQEELITICKIDDYAVARNEIIVAPGVSYDDAIEKALNGIIKSAGSSDSGTFSGNANPKDVANGTNTKILIEKMK